MRLKQEAEAAAARLEAHADHGLLGPLRRRYVRWLIRTYHGTVYFREYPKQEAAKAFTAWRRALLDAGELLVTATQLDHTLVDVVAPNTSHLLERPHRLDRWWLRECLVDDTVSVPHKASSASCF
ncbi:hypothetical protein [Haloarcula sp. JP-L23]|uniref:hypothetical protein n=1 Tax=Haloarcula sp. JP-L23 TaxID=2716717 RepID=UPI00140F17FB|nr:hypothetical protein G9465_18610 [Haloarcula sp. JP-L23]